MSTIITSDNGVEITVGLLALEVTDPVSATGIYARLSDAQRIELAAALDPGRRGLHVRLDNQAATLATYRRELDEALRKKGEMVDRAVRAEQELGELRSKVNAWGRERTAPAVSRAEIVEQLRIAYESGNHPIQRIRIATDAVCDLFGVEAEQATDPVEEKARELWGVVHADDGVEWEQAVSHVHERYFRLARHVLGREADQ